MIEFPKGSKIKRSSAIDFKAAVNVYDAEGNHLGMADAYQRITWREPDTDKEKSAFVLLMTHKDPEWSRLQNFLFAIGQLRVEQHLGGMKDILRTGASVIKGEALLTADDIRKMAEEGEIHLPQNPKAWVHGK